MEQNFQTSFIPKKPIISESTTIKKPVGPLVIISIFLLFAVLIFAGGLYFYKEATAKKIEKMQKDLGLAQSSFEPAKITELQVLDKRLRAANEILNNHMMITPVFEALEAMTLKTVRFTDFDYSIDAETAQIKVAMSGEAKGYRYVALQSDIFAKNKNFIDPVFSNLTLDQAGNVLFDLEFSVDPAFVNYKQNVLAES